MARRSAQHLQELRFADAQASAEHRPIRRSERLFHDLPGLGAVVESLGELDWIIEIVDEGIGDLLLGAFVPGFGRTAVLRHEQYLASAGERLDQRVIEHFDVAVSFPETIERAPHSVRVEGSVLPLQQTFDEIARHLVAIACSLAPNRVQRMGRVSQGDLH